MRPPSGRSAGLGPLGAARRRSAAGADTPARAAARALGELRAAGTAARAAGARAYFKAYEKLRFFGVDGPTVRRLAATIAKRHGATWGLAGALEFAEALIERPELEAKGLGLCVLGSFRRDFTPALLPLARRWLERHCTDWASADLLCGEVLHPLLGAHPALARRLRSWRTARALYVRRASGVALIGLAARGEALSEAYAAALALGAEEHHLLQKAAGWLLRQAGKVDLPRLERFLRRHGRRLSRTTISYAVERFAPPARRALLAATRP